MARGLSSCGSRALEHGLRSCGTPAEWPHGIWNLPGPGIEPVSPVLAGIQILNYGTAREVLFLTSCRGRGLGLEGARLKAGSPRGGCCGGSEDSLAGKEAAGGIGEYRYCRSVWAPVSKTGYYTDC